MPEPRWTADNLKSVNIPQVAERLLSTIYYQHGPASANSWVIGTLIALAACGYQVVRQPIAKAADPLAKMEE